MSNILKYWSDATTDLSMAIASFMSCIWYGYDAQLVVRENTDPELGANAVMMINPLLNDHRNWTCSCQILSRANLDNEDRRYLNQTHRDLMENYTVFYGTEEAAALYWEKGQLSKDMHFLATDIQPAGKKMDWYPVRKDAATCWRQKYHPDSPVSYENSPFTAMWSPKAGIPVRVPDPSIGKVYAILFAKDRAPGEVGSSGAERIDEAIAVLRAFQASLPAGSIAVNALPSDALV